MLTYMEKGKISVSFFDRIIDLSGKLAIPLPSSGPEIGLNILVGTQSEEGSLAVSIGLHDLADELANLVMAITEWFIAAIRISA